MKTLALTAACALLTGCAVGGRYTPPVPPTTAVGPFIGSQEAGAASTPLPAQWWRLLDNPVLNGHVERALAANTDVRTALANLQTARAVARQADAARLPIAGLESGVGPDRADTQPSTATLPKSSYELGLTVAYEIDLFGRLASASTAARADADAAQAALEAARVAVVADTVLAYADVCTGQGGEAIAERQIANQQRAHDLIAEQLAAGEVSPLELAQAALLRDRARLAAPVFAAQRRRGLLQLAALQGLPAAEASKLTIECGAPLETRSLPVGDGAALLARRPDLRQAERRLAAAAARVNVATSDLYPRIRLGASGGLIGGGSDAVLTPLITWNILDVAGNRARIAAAHGTADAALATWDGAMLRALREVEQALSDYAAETARRAAAVAARDEAGKALTRVEARWKWGADNYLAVVDASRSANDAQTEAYLANLRVTQAQVALFRALGGGWENPAPVVTSSP